MRVESVFLVAVAIGMAIGESIGRQGTREATLVAKVQDRAPLDRPMDGLARAQAGRGSAALGVEKGRFPDAVSLFAEIAQLWNLAEAT